jgi:hypothetical protein
MSEALTFSNSALNKFCVDHVMNGFKNQTLQTHCKSKDDDLGLQHDPAINAELVQG